MLLCEGRTRLGLGSRGCRGCGREVGGGEKEKEKEKEERGCGGRF